MDYRTEKRESYRQHFFNHPIADIAAFTDDFLETKLSDAGLIRHLGKLKAIRDNAIAWQALKAQVGDVSKWLWQFVDAAPQNNDVADYRKAPAQTELSLKLSKTLKKMVSNLLVQPPAMLLCKQWVWSMTMKTIVNLKLPNPPERFKSA